MTHQNKCEIYSNSPQSTSSSPRTSLKVCAEGHHSHSHQEVSTGQGGNQAIGWRMQLLEVKNGNHYQEVSKYSQHSSKDEHCVQEEAGSW